MRSLPGPCLPLAFAVAAGALSIVAGDASAQPCITCRTEDCPDKAGASGWCGRGRDPHAGGATTSEPRKRPRQSGVACPSGKQASRDTQGHCCWPGQAWSGARNDCVGDPTSCPPGTVARGNDCVAQAPEAPPATQRPEPVAPPVAHEEQLPAQLSRDDVVRAMGGVAGAVRQCYLTFQIFGTCTIEAVVEPSGRVRSARATGRFADNSEGGCVADAVKRALFHPFRGPAQTVTFPFQMQ